MVELIQRIPPWFWIALVVHVAVLGTVAYLILLERKVASWAQDRVGPNRVGPRGLLQPLADGLKFILKEDYRPDNAEKRLFTIAPAIMAIVIIISIAIIPWGGVKQTTREFDVTGRIDPATATEAQREELARGLVPWGTAVVDQQLRVETTETILREQVTRVYATVTFQYHFQIANLNVGVLFALAALSLAVYGVVIGGWASNNKYSFLGGLRATANMISYEIPLGLTVITIVMMFGTLNLADIVENQAHLWAGFIPAWNIFAHPLVFIMFLVCIHAEANRAPFDTAEAEQELVGGYHTEYSSMRFALFFLAEYSGMVTTAAICVALFFGGWHLPGLAGPVPQNPALTESLGLCLLRAFVFFAKTLLIVAVFMWVRWSLPRFRFDQILRLAWRGLIPIAMVLMLATAITIYFYGPRRVGMRLDGEMALVLLGVNVAVTIVVMIVGLFLPESKANRRILVPGSRFQRAPALAG